MFYDTRQSIAISDSDPANNPNTRLTETPQRAEVEYPDQPPRLIEADRYDVDGVDGFKVARFLISRALLDPDATVVPQ
jgi:hypothetical protein